mmetsp:Transcript_8266/g.8432  ORF Transcript_8266/g.8432 Transcript_8266/m.8432 type:complete len:132 (-) Transcript_8266:70-465(-)
MSIGGISQVHEAEKVKAQLRDELVALEKQIYECENQYLEDTKNFGNILTGWDIYFNKERKPKTKRSILNEDKLFSLSSITSPATKKEDYKKSNKEDNEYIISRKHKKRKSEMDGGYPDENTNDSHDELLTL